MGGACGTYGKEEKCIQSVGGETRKNNLEDPDMECNMKMDLQEK